MNKSTNQCFFFFLSDFLGPFTKHHSTPMAAPKSVDPFKASLAELASSQVPYSIKAQPFTKPVLLSRLRLKFLILPYSENFSFTSSSEASSWMEVTKSIQPSTDFNGELAGPCSTVSCDPQEAIFSQSRVSTNPRPLRFSTFSRSFETMCSPSSSSSMSMESLMSNMSVGAAEGRTCCIIEFNW